MSLNISTNIIIYPGIPSSLSNLTISQSCQSLVKSFSIRFSTKMLSHPQAEQMRTDDCDCYRVVVQSYGFHLSPVTAWTRPDSACSESLNFEILLLEKSSFQSKWRFLNFPPKIFQNFDENFIGTSEHIHNHQKVPCCMKKFQIF